MKSVDETTLLPSAVEPKEIVYRDKIRTIQKVTARFDGFSKEYYVSDHGRRAAVVVVRDGDILLVRQYRLFINSLAYEIPGGAINENEAPQDAAVRECLEETAVKCFNLKSLINYHISLDVHKNFTNVFFADCFEQMPTENPDSRIWIPIDQCIEMIFDGGIIDSLSIIALLAYQTLQSRHKTD